MIGLVLLNSCDGFPVLDLAAVYRDDSGRIMVRYTSSSDFRREDIDSLRPGQLWAKGEAMSRDRFRAYIRDAC
ncbi:hypothetical protein M8Z33_21100 [Streptomyces sp. ZAF1911]|uniref:hypothetical protein n=1 Tax=Streptomyces sp. ZAF1911 TaxID=2944129 RepID=UPI00237A2982|nr:hypothetical protein [Streptomyces sp. ZAF1911]MDD9379111.1 hypothetical protein [Streptomyces sp. ZAF1911]